MYGTRRDGTVHLPARRGGSQHAPRTYRVRVELVQRRVQWIINPNVQQNLALVCSMQQGNVRAGNEKYRQRP